MSLISIFLAVIIAAVLIIILMAVTSRKSKGIQTNKGSLPKNKSVIVKECTKKLTFVITKVEDRRILEAKLFVEDITNSEEDEDEE